jgi:hypothetical protein
MNKYSLPVLTTATILFFSSCNHHDKTPEQITVNDTSATIATNIPPLERDTATEDPDYGKRNINLTNADFLAFKNKFHLNADIGQTLTGKFKPAEMVQTLYVIPPVEDTIHKDAFQDCLGGCNTYIVSSDNTMPVLKVTSNLGGQVKDIGDIDGDGYDEIMVYPDWWQSNWNAYMVYSYNNTTNQWRYLIEPVSIFANELEKKIKFVKPSTRKGYASAYTSVMEDVNLKNSYKDYKIIK